jgi:hypothetical protein
MPTDRLEPLRAADGARAVELLAGRQLVRGTAS